MKQPLKTSPRHGSHIGTKTKYGVCLIVTALLAGCGGDDGNVPGNTVAGCGGTANFRELEGTFPNGTKWNIRKPANWNGLLISDLDYVGARDSDRSCFWLKRGYALSGTDRNPQRAFNYDPAREIKELLSVIDTFTESYGKPKRVIQYGHSGGGFVAMNLAELYPDRIDGAVAGCAHEQVPLMNMMYDGWFVLRTLIAPELQIDGYDNLQSVADQSAKWRAALTAAQQTEVGRARIALAATIGQWPAWSSPTKSRPATTDLDALLEAMVDTALLNANQPGGQSRFMSEHAGESPVPRQLSWNTGIDYRQLFDQGDPAHIRLVQSLYGKAGVDLQSELAAVNGALRLQANPEAVKFWSQPGRSVHGKPLVPVLRIHALGDNIVPPQITAAYVQKMEANKGPANNYRSAFIDRPGHCTFDPAESAAAVETLLSRLDTGIWPETSPLGMNAKAKSLIPTSNPQYIDYAPVKASRPHNNPSGDF